MVGWDNLAELFRTKAQLVAFAHCLSDAERRHAGVVLTLNASQLARDGLQTAARAFANFADQRGVRGEAAETLALTTAQMAPTHVWWHPLYLTSKPPLLGPDDTWRSLQDLREIAQTIARLNADCAEVRRA